MSNINEHLSEDRLKKLEPRNTWNSKKDRPTSNLIDLINGTNINLDLDFNFKIDKENKCLCGNKIYKYNRRKHLTKL